MSKKGLKPCYLLWLIWFSALKCGATEQLKDGTIDGWGIVNLDPACNVEDGVPDE